MYNVSVADIFLFFCFSLLLLLRLPSKFHARTNNNYLLFCFVRRFRMTISTFLNHFACISRYSSQICCSSSQFIIYVFSWECYYIKLSSIRLFAAQHFCFFQRIKNVLTLFNVHHVSVEKWHTPLTHTTSKNKTPISFVEHNVPIQKIYVLNAKWLVLNLESGTLSGGREREQRSNLKFKHKHILMAGDDTGRVNLCRSRLLTALAWLMKVPESIFYRINLSVRRENQKKSPTKKWNMEELIIVKFDENASLQPIDACSRMFPHDPTIL